MDTNDIALIIAVLTLFFTAVSTYIAYKAYLVTIRGRPRGKICKCKQNKSNRKSLRKISVAFTIKVTRK